MTEPQVIGWQVTDPDGNVVQSGGISIAEMTAEVLEALGLEPPTDGEGA